MIPKVCFNGIYGYSFRDAVIFLLEIPDVYFLRDKWLLVIGDSFTGLVLAKVWFADCSIWGARRFIFLDAYVIEFYGM